MQPEDPLETERKHRAERAARLGRLKQWLRPLPRRSNLSRYPVIKYFADAARRNPQLWSFQRPAMRRAIYLGSIIAFLPVYGLHLLIALGLAILLRANLAVTSALLFITNPLTAGPIYYGAYRIGIWWLEVFHLIDGVDAVGTRLYALILGGLLLGLGVGLIVDLIYQIGAWEAGQLRRRHALAVERAAQERAVRERASQTASRTETAADSQDEKPAADEETPPRG